MSPRIAVLEIGPSSVRGHASGGRGGSNLPVARIPPGLRTEEHPRRTDEVGFALPDTRPRPAGNIGGTRRGARGTASTRRRAGTSRTPGNAPQEEPWLRNEREVPPLRRPSEIRPWPRCTQYCRRIAGMPPVMVTGSGFRGPDNPSHLPDVEVWSFTDAHRAIQVRTILSFLTSGAAKRPPSSALRCRAAGPEPVPFERAGATRSVASRRLRRSLEFRSRNARTRFGARLFLSQ
jgi:hypothetical protein